MRIKNVLFASLLSLMLTGCKTHEQVVEVVRTDTIIVKNIQRDSIYIEQEKHDSVYIHQQGDTVLIEKWHTEWRDRWRDKVLHDSIYIAKRDTVTHYIEVEKSLTKWQQMRLTLGGVMLWMMLALGIIGAWKLWRKFKI